MRRRLFLTALLAAPLLGGARAQARLRRIAVVALGSLEKHPLASLVEELHRLGYEQGRNIEILAPWPNAGYGQLPKMAATAVAGNAEAIVAYGATATRAARKATTTVPIVMVVGTDPIAMGFVTNLARPEANVTGLATTTQVLIAKRVELMKEILPGLRRLAALWNSTSAGQTASLAMLREAAGRVGVATQAVDLRGRKGLEGVAELLVRDRPDALTALSTTTLAVLGPQIVRLAAELRLPAVYSDAQLVRQGGLVAYSPDARAQLRRAAYYVDRILKGAKPADLAVEQPTKFELAVNLKTAKTLGLAIPAGIMIRADEVVQ